MFSAMTFPYELFLATGGRTRWRWGATYVLHMLSRHRVLLLSFMQQKVPTLVAARRFGFWILLAFCAKIPCSCMGLALMKPDMTSYSNVPRRLFGVRRQTCSCSEPLFPARSSRRAIESFLGAIPPLPA